MPARCVALRVRSPGRLGSCSPVCPLGVLFCVCSVLATWLLFTGVPAWCVVLLVRCPGRLGSCSPVCPCGALLCLCGVLGHLAPVHRCAHSPRCVACAVSWATWLLFTGVHARCVALRVRCPGPLGSCSPVCPLGALLCLCGVLGHLAPVHRCDRSVCCFACAVSWPLGSCSPVCPLGVLCCLCGVLGDLAPVHRCACVVPCFACAVSWASWLLFTGVPTRRVVLHVRCPGPLGSCSSLCMLGALLCVCGVLGHLAPVHQCARSVCCLCVQSPGPLGSCSPVCPLGVLCCLCGVLGDLAPVHRCARAVRCFACAVSWATWLLFTGVPTRRVVLHVRCPGPLGSCSSVCTLGALLCVCGVLGHLAPVHQCARSVCCLCVQSPGPLGSCSPVCPLGVLCGVCGVLGHFAPVHRCARSVCCVACAVSWATWLLFIGVPARCAVCVCGVLGHLAPGHGFARSVCCVACAVSWATWLLLTGVPARCVALRVRCPGPLGSCSRVCLLGALLCLCGVLGHLAPVHRCARSVCCLCVRCHGPLGSCSPVCPLGVLFCLCGVLGRLAAVHRCARLVRCFACAVSWATWLLFTGVPARCVVLLVRSSGPLGCCSPVCPLGALLCMCGVLGHLAPVHRCGRSVCCFACAVSWATWLLFTGVPAWSVVLLVRCPGRLGSCSPVCPCGALLCLCGVLGHLAPVHRCAHSPRCVACAVSWATWLLFTGVHARCVALRVRCPGPLGSCSPVCPLGALLCLCGVLGHLAPVHRCDRSVCCFACAVSWPLGSCSPVCPLGVLCCLCGVLGDLAPVHRCACVVPCFACAVSWASWLLFTGVPTRRVVLHVRCPGPLGSCSSLGTLGALLCVCGVLGHLAPVHQCARSVCCLCVQSPGPLGSCSPVCPLGVLCCLCGVLGDLAPVHRCARAVPCFACAVSWATWLLTTGVPTRRVVLHVRCPGPLGSCSSVCTLGALLCVCGVLGHLAPVHQCARSVCCLCVQSPGPLGSCSPVCPLGVLCGVCGVLGHFAPVHRCARSVCCVACAVSWATWLLFIGVPARCAVCVCGVLGHLAPGHGFARSVCCVACAVSWATWLLFTVVPARCVVLRVRCPGPLGSCSPVCLLGALLCVCGVLGHLAPVQGCACSVRCFACAVSWATWLLFTGVPARCVVCVCGVMGHLAPVHRCAPSVFCFACAVSWADWLLFTGVPAWCVALRVRCPGPLGSCSPVCPLGVLFCLCGVPGHLAAVHRCARSVRCFACAVSWATWLLFTGVVARCVVLLVRCPGPLGSCSPVCPLGVLPACAVF